MKNVFGCDINKRKIYIVIAVCCVFVALFYLLFNFLSLNGAQHSVLYIVIFIGICSTLRSCLLKENSCVGKRWEWVLGFILSASTVTGIYFANGIPYEVMGKDVIGYVMCIFFLTPLFKCIFTKIYSLVEEIAENEKKRENIIQGSVRKTFVISFAVIFGCWLFVWLAYYPGLWNYDPWQVDQVINKSYNEFHPLIHTLLLGHAYTLGLKIGNPNYGVIIYDFVQMLIMAGIFAYTYCYICRNINNKVYRGFILLFYAVFPVNSVLAISTTKDAIFSGLVLLCIVLWLQITESENTKRKRLYIFMLIVCPLMMLFRNNAVYAFCLLGICSLFLGLRSKNSLKVFAFMCLCLLLFFMERSFLRNTLEAGPGSSNEIFSIPSQQFGRIYSKIKEGDDPDTLNIINSYYDMEKLEYKPYIADYIKAGLHLDEETSVFDYLQASLKLFKRYPIISVDSFLYLTDGYWNINSTSFTSLYETEWDGNIEHRYGYLLTTIKPGYGITPDSKIPWLEKYMERLISRNDYQYCPIVSLMFAPALYLWILVMSTVLFLKRKKKEYIFIAGFLWFLLITLLAGPCVLVRYVYPFMICSPVLCSLSIKEISNS